MQTTIKWRDAANEKPPTTGHYLAIKDNGALSDPYFAGNGWLENNGSYSGIVVKVTHFALPSDITTTEDA